MIVATTPPPDEAIGLLPGLGNDCHELVAIDDGAIFIDYQHAVGIAIQRDADVGSHFVHFLDQAQADG